MQAMPLLPSVGGVCRHARPPISSALLLGSNGQRFEKRSRESRAQGIGADNGGIRTVESTCSEGPSTPGITGALTLLIGSIGLVSWMSKGSTPSPHITLFLASGFFRIFGIYFRDF